MCFVFLQNVIVIVAITYSMSYASAADGEKNFTRGKTDSFIVRELDLGAIESVTISHDGHRSKPLNPLGSFLVPKPENSRLARTTHVP